VDRLHLPCSRRLLRRCFNDAGLFPVQRRDGLSSNWSRSGLTRPGALLTSIATSGATAFLIIMAMTFGLILPRMLFERVNALSRMMRHDRSMHRRTVSD